MPPSDRPTLATLARWLDASTAEVVGLLVLLAGGAVLALLLTGQVPVATSMLVATTPAAPTGAPTLTQELLTVHVAGEVVRRGVVVMPGGSRVSDAIAAAGGPSAAADLDGLNLARLLEDGERIVVPAMGEPGAAVGTSDTAVADDGRVDLNRATAADFETLPGIGPVLAGRIIAWREQHGPFREVGQLREVSGIGERTFQSLVDLVRV